MKILLIDGRVVIIPDAKRMQPGNRDKELECLTSRDRVIATFTVANVVGWWFDNEAISIEAPQTTPEVSESLAGRNAAGVDVSKGKERS